MVSIEISIMTRYGKDVPSNPMLPLMFDNLIDLFPGGAFNGKTIPISLYLERARVSAHILFGFIFYFLAVLGSWTLDQPVAILIIGQTMFLFPSLILLLEAKRKKLLFLYQFLHSLLFIVIYALLAIFAIYPLAVISVIVYPLISLFCLDSITYYTQLELNVDTIGRRILFAIFGPAVYRVLGVDPQKVKTQEWVLKQIEDLALLSFKMYRATNNIDRSLEIAAFFKYRSTHSLLYGLTQDHYLEKFESIFDSYIDNEKAPLEVTNEVMVAQSLEEVSLNVNEFTKQWSSLRKSELAKRVYKMSMYIMTSGVLSFCGLTFDAVGYKNFEAATLKKKFNIRSTDFLTTMLETTNFFLSKGYAIFKGAPIDTLLDPLSSYEEWMIMVRWLEEKRNFISNPGAAGFEEFDYRLKLDTCVEQGEEILKFLRRVKSDDKVIIETKLAAMKKMRTDLITLEDASKPKDPPFSVLLHGIPNIGKTTIISILHQHFGKICGLPTGSAYIYVRNGLSEFWDGFKTRMWCLFLDDISFRRVDVCKAGGDPSTMEIVNVINPAPFIPNQAALEDKGRTPFKGKLVLGTTNVKFLNTGSYFTTPSAAMRRFRYIIEVIVKPEYANPDGTLDFSKAPPVDGYPDLWIYKVEKPILAADPRFVAMKPIGTFPTRKLFLQWYTSVIEKYIEEIEVVRKSEEAINNVEYCKQCRLPTVDCACADSDLPMIAQSGCVKNVPDRRGMPSFCNCADCYTCTGEFDCLCSVCQAAAFAYEPEPHPTYCSCAECLADAEVATLFKDAKQDDKYSTTTHILEEADADAYMAEKMDQSSTDSWDSHETGFLSNGEYCDCKCHHCFIPPKEVEETKSDSSETSRDTWESHETGFLPNGEYRDCKCHHCLHVPKEIPKVPTFVPEPVHIRIQREWDALPLRVRLYRILKNKIYNYVRERSFRKPDDEIPIAPVVEPKEKPSVDPNYRTAQYFFYFANAVAAFFFKGRARVKLGEAQRKVDQDVKDNIAYLTEMGRVFKQKCEAKSFAEFTEFEKYHATRVVNSTKEDFDSLIVRAKLLHERAMRYVSAPKMFALLITVITAILIGWQVTNKMTGQSGRAPVSTDDEKQNVWYTKEFDLQTFDAPIDANSIRLGDMCGLLNKATYYVTSSVEGAEFGDAAKWFKVKGYFFVTVNHGVPDGDFEVKAVMTPTVDGVTPNFRAKVSSWQVYRDPERDLAMIYLPHSSPGRDLTKFMLPNGDKFNSRGEGTLHTRSPTGIFTSTRIAYTNRVTQYPYTHKDQMLNIDGWTYTMFKNPSAGLCGSPVLLHTAKGYIIGGIHAASHFSSKAPELSIDGSYTCGAQILTTEWIDAAIATFPPELPNATPTAPLMTSDSGTVIIGPLHHKSPVRFFSEGELAVYGSLSSGRVRMKSRVQDHMLLEDVNRELGWEKEFHKPVMTGWEPWRHPLAKIVDPPRLDPGYLKMAADGYIADIKRYLPKSEKLLLHPYDLFTAINGAAAIGYVDSINRGTSAGFPWRRSKRYFLEPDISCEQAMDPVKPTQEVLDRYHIMLANMKARRMNHPIFIAHLKDEPVSQKKFDEKRTRVFMGAPMDWTIAVRQYLLSFVRVVQRNKGVFEAMPGLVCQSSEWHYLYAYLTKFGEFKVDDGDHVMFDYSTTKDPSTLAWYVIISILLWCGGYNEEDMNCVHSIALDASNAVVDYNGDLIQLHGQTPSGFPLTVIINCIVNSIYMRYAYIKLSVRINYVSECFTFRANVALACYGDDNIFGSGVDWFCVFGVAQVLGEDGLQYTPADKSKPSPGFKRIQDCAFLKRTFRFEDELGLNVAPLEEKSIRKMLTVWVASKTVTQQEQAAATVYTAVCEYFWYGRTKFNKMRRILVKIVDARELTPYLPRPLPTWEELVEDFEERSKQSTPLFRHEL